jgi:Flp pilus assembly protein TadD
VVNQNALWVGTICSRSLNDWGVQLQRAGELDKAAVRFNSAREFNPDNVVADINLDFNRSLRAGTPPVIDLTRVTTDRFGKYRNWNEVITANGMFDDISFCIVNGLTFMQDGMLRQAALLFTRVRQLAPDNLGTRLQLAQIYLFNRLPDRALEALHDPLTQPSRFGLNDANSTGINTLAAAADFQKKDDQAGARLLELEVERHPDDETLLEAVSEAFSMHGLYTNSLQVIDRHLARSPADIRWIFGKGLVSFQMGAYENTVTAMSKVLESQTNNSAARFNRALAYLNLGKLDQARADYNALQNTFTNSFQIAYGLGDIAARQHDTNEAVRNFQIYLTNAPTNSAEYKSVRERLTQLRGQ